MDTTDLPGATALVTGASAGIGRAYAERLAARGTHLILVARRRARLDELAAQLRAEHQVRVDVLALDLTQPAAADTVAAELDRLGLTVDVLVNNAGFATHGRIDTIDPATDRDQVQVNSVALVALCHLLIPPMLARGRGLVLNMSSIAGYQPIPFMAVYGATKAFNLHFSEALWQETRGTGVTVTAVCPGATDTEFFDVVGNREEALFGTPVHPSVVVDQSLRAALRGQPSVVVGVGNRVTTLLPRWVPRRVVLAIAARQTRPRTPAPTAVTAA